jgi:hypothetical protein
MGIVVLIYYEKKTIAKVQIMMIRETIKMLLYKHREIETK